MNTSETQSKGFTLIELMVAIAIIGILASIAIPDYIAYRDKSYCSKVESDVHINAKAATGWMIEHTGLSGFTPKWSTGVSQQTLTLQTDGELVVAASDDENRCPPGTTYTITGGSSSGKWM